MIAGAPRMSGRPILGQPNKMERWQKERVHRSKEQPIYCDRVECTDDACFIFSVVGEGEGEREIESERGTEREIGR